jgi:hypothetical protein
MVGPLGSTKLKNDAVVDREVVGRGVVDREALGHTVVAGREAVGPVVTAKGKVADMALEVQKSFGIVGPGVPKMVVAVVAETVAAVGRVVTIGSVVDKAVVALASVNLTASTAPLLEEGSTRSVPPKR